MARGATSPNGRVGPGGGSPTISTERIRMTTTQSTASSVCRSDVGRLHPRSEITFWPALTCLLPLLVLSWQAVLPLRAAPAPIGICILRRDLWEKWLILRSRAVGLRSETGYMNPMNNEQSNQQLNPTTTDAGIPVASDDHSLTIGTDGPILLQDHYLIEQMANFNRERIPERQPHAKGSGAFGHFEVTGDVSAYTRAAVFQPGTKTDTLIRFSTVAGERGSPDTWRDPRGFSLRFYTSEGNLDIVGNNTPVFFMRDPMKFQHFIRSQKRRADNNLRDNDMQWDFWTLTPESAHQVAWLMGDRGIPRTWRHMNGYSSHTYMWVNAQGEKFWVKYHFTSDQGIECFTQDEADQMASADTDYHQRDVFDHNQAGGVP